MIHKITFTITKSLYRTSGLLGPFFMRGLLVHLVKRNIGTTVFTVLYLLDSTYSNLNWNVNLFM